MGLFKVIGGVVKGTATVVGGVAKGTALVAEGVAKGTVAIAEGISDVIEEEKKKEKEKQELYAKSIFIVPEGTTTINSKTFKDYKNERTVILPSTLERIEKKSFEKCKNVDFFDFSKVTKVKEFPSRLFDDLRIKEINIPEGVKELKDEVFSSCSCLQKITLPNSLERIGCLVNRCSSLEEIDVSKVRLLKKIPSKMMVGSTRIRKFAIPYGVETVERDSLDYRILELYVPSTVVEIGEIKYFSSSASVYIYTDKLDDIDIKYLCKHFKYLYCSVKAFSKYQAIKKSYGFDNVRLEIMQSCKERFYEKLMKESTIKEDSSTKEQTLQKQETPKVQKSPDNLFSDGLEELINSVAESDELTDKKKEIVLRRAIKEGEDPDEVEMVLEARFYEAHNK